MRKPLGLSTLWVCVSLCGCGDGGGDGDGGGNGNGPAASCYYPVIGMNRSMQTCRDYAFESASARDMNIADLEQACHNDNNPGLATQAEWSDAACDTTDTLGGCEYSMQGYKLTEWFFGATYESLLGQVKDACGGTWKEP